MASLNCIFSPMCNVNLNLGTTWECNRSGIDTVDAIPREMGNTNKVTVLVICVCVLMTMQR